MGTFGKGAVLCWASYVLLIKLIKRVKYFSSQVQNDRTTFHIWIDLISQVIQSKVYIREYYSHNKECPLKIYLQKLAVHDCGNITSTISDRIFYAFVEFLSFFYEYLFPNLVNTKYNVISCLSVHTM